MKLYATVTSERASKGQGGNEYVLIDFTAGDKDNHIGQVELYLYDDDVKQGSEENEWLLKWRRNEDDDWHILSQGHIDSTKQKGKKKKGGCPHNNCDDDAICINCGEQQ